MNSNPEHTPVPAAGAKKKSAWSNLQAKIKKRNLTKSFLLSSATYDKAHNAKWPDDERESQFCDALVGLMHRNGKHHDLGEYGAEALKLELQKKETEQTASAVKAKTLHEHAN
ncbi:MAG: hypothetical protein Q9170_002924 [Blastenia crenularia]